MTPESAPTLETLDKERVLHPATSIADHLKTGPRIMTEGSGITLTDTAGRRYLERRPFGRTLDSPLLTLSPVPIGAVGIEPTTCVL